MNQPIVIVGAGHAGSELASALRKRGHAGRIILVGEEAHLPYQRPPLSKGFLLGKVAQSQLYLKTQAIYEQNSIELRPATRVVSIDRTSQELTLASGERLAYGKLVLATGSRPRRLGFPGVELARLGNLLCLRTIADAEALREKLQPGRRLVVIGGGYIGLEVAAVAVQQGLQVTVVEALPRLLARVTGAEVAAFIEKTHRAHGVSFRLGTTVAELELDPEGSQVRAVVTAGPDGAERLAVDLVLLGVGIVPNSELAAAAGLAVDNGIVVDEYAQTSDPAILAIGDCTSQPSPHTGGRVRLESVPNAMEQARVAAATLTGQPEASTAVPWFWSEQYGFRLQMVGLSTGHDRCVTRQSPDGKEILAFYLKEGRLIAADVIGKPADFAAARRLVASRAALDPARLADASVALGELAA
ncbi:MAG TPA: FAD-dependent oxidoreductase [Pseudomonadota bacterium]|nr:FAD-dependent oxidoreductase [Pseudomonadota bacterium]